MDGISVMERGMGANRLIKNKEFILIFFKNNNKNHTQYVPMTLSQPRVYKNSEAFPGMGDMRRGHKIVLKTSKW